MKQLVRVLSIIFAVILISSCSGDEGSVDLIKPMADIRLTRENGVYSPGSSILIDADFTDDKALKECQVTVASARSPKGWNMDWDAEMDKIPLSGQTYRLSGTRILDDIPVDIYYGEYQLSFKILDDANNYSLYTIDIVIE